MGITQFSHFGICVSDMERSLAFYRDCLGFTEQYGLEFGPRFGPVMELDGVRGRSVFLARDGVRIELLAYDHPGVVGSAEPRPMNRLGMTHIGLRVDDLAATVESLRRAGVQILDGTHLAVKDAAGRQPGEWIFVCDPDGVRVELIELPDGFVASRDDSPSSA